MSFIDLNAPVYILVTRFIVIYFFQHTTGLTGQFFPGIICNRNISFKIQPDLCVIFIGPGSCRIIRACRLRFIADPEIFLEKSRLHRFRQSKDIFQALDPRCRIYCDRRCHRYRICIIVWVLQTHTAIHIFLSGRQYICNFRTFHRQLRICYLKRPCDRTVSVHLTVFRQDIRLFDLLPCLCSRINWSCIHITGHGCLVFK